MRDLLDGLRQPRREREGLWPEPGYVFATATGGRWEEKNLGRAFGRQKTRCVDDDGNSLVRPRSFHCGRHTFASRALEGGRSIVWLQHTLGHSSPDTTLPILLCGAAGSGTATDIGAGNSRVSRP
jgi:integrase